MHECITNLERNGEDKDRHTHTEINTDTDTCMSMLNYRLRPGWLKILKSLFILVILFEFLSSPLLICIFLPKPSRHKPESSFSIIDHWSLIIDLPLPAHSWDSCRDAWKHFCWIIYHTCFSCYQCVGTKWTNLVAKKKYLKTLRMMSSPPISKICNYLPLLPALIQTTTPPCSIWHIL